jgi:glycosyltransferase involved in cell wall biosynthesis
VRICIVYDCLYPYTVGGAERWYRNLAERLAEAGHEVTFLTLRQWDRRAVPHVPGVDVVAVAPGMRLYAGGKRRIWPPLRFGLGVLRHLLRRGGWYDAVHTASLPYFSLLAAGISRRRHAFRLVVDWHEVWTQEYWREYAGPVAGTIGWRVQGACLQLRQHAFCFSRLHERRLRELRVRGAVRRLTGQYAGADEPAQPLPAEPVVVFAGRHIPEKRVPTLVPAIARAREQVPELRGELYGDGPERRRVLRSIAELGLDEHVKAPGFVDESRIDESLARALCLVLPSRREGYGLVVVEAAARGVPSVVVEGPDNAAAELVEEGVNGTIAPSASPDDLAAAVMRIHAGGPELRGATSAWFSRNAARLSIESSLAVVLEAYARG